MEIKPKNTIQPKPVEQAVTSQVVETVEEKPMVQVEQSTLETEKQYPDAMSNVFVSDSLSDLEKMLDEEDTGMIESTPNTSNVIPMNEKTDIASLLSNIKIDLNNIELSTGSVMDIQRTEVLFNSKPTKQVVCCQSAYKAEVSALNSQEITNLMESDNDYYTYRKKISQIVHKHIESTSVGKINYPTFAKITSYYDFETLLYGVYCQTFPNNNKYNVKCPAKDCHKTINATANNNTLVETRGKDDVFARVNEIIGEVRSTKDCVEKSSVHKIKRVALDETKVIADIHIPTIEDYLEGILSKVTPEFSENYSTSLGIALFISKLYIPNLAELKDKGTLSFIEVTDKMKIVEYVGRFLTYEDGLQLTEEINTFTEKYRVYYSLKKVQCKHCGHIIDEIPLDMEELLFRTVRQGRQKQTEEDNEQNM